ncbi:MAG: hypothetical protein A2418_03125 [Candidatus Brennerbacteria bacterium RIFOXYC1_FULL_41_11]|uniref:FtsK domain-containing protein n=1 Tax=Candidatus Brennerbacteria bacterium RIFOXYD1_FULL_41_16 TaxID=1797529 RepID=A0A1G1XMN8_9BACT|nr:MAG: hypothetical protein A2391_00730 [Candidatus Brennerbacteria bacterium RIFOXYB1_FULL_41_13]OGY39824.1 MAG: hypothetical protein A2418_03125 [Candidatus Brennerbacteria bacterium RIFOXYC1_FULL_41_11]OGY40577.1 MAG: hypothetical protein A2570_02475 [Candidatus Brennerbacteria bacterium RIFOXYD1_FULL_41_16]
MAKKKKSQKSTRSRFSFIKFPSFSFDFDPEVKRIVLAIFFVFLGCLSLLSFFELSGPIGMLLRVLLEDFFGIGKWLVPFVCFGLAIFLFNKNEEEEYYFGTGLGIFLILLSLLGLGDLFESGLTGKFGWILGSLENIIGFFPSLIAFILLFLVGLVVDFWQIFKSYLKNRKEKFALTKPEKKGLLKIRMPEGKVERLLPNEEVEQILDEERPVIASFLKSKKFKKAFVDASGWEFPPLDLLEVDGAKPTVGDIRINSQVIQRTLEDFGIPVEMGEVNIGPTVTQYTLKPAQGVKLSRIVALQNDLALALAAHPLRIEAPIPGKSLVGIEVPNKTPSLVRLRSLLESPAYNESPAALLFPLGRDVMGNAVMADISKLPHLLVAGATGTGKSIFIHSVITSLIYRNSPQNLRFILIDPKRVELSAYENIPYLLCPVILEGKKAIMALKWATQEMERRYDLLLSEHSRDIHSYNQKIGSSKEKTLPYIVIFIDELADLMSVYGKDLEAVIVRLSQMARATGIHLIVSTQRPSVEVITGLIKANITARTAFQVASQVDSRTILDTAGAEKLLGRGDSLFVSAETSKPKRIQGPMISEKESEKVVEFLKNKGKEILGEDYGYDSDLSEMLIHEAQDQEETLFDVGDDELYQEAYEVVVKVGKASASLLQRYLKVGYARAARLLDILEARSVIGPSQGAKPREVYSIEGSAFIDQAQDKITIEANRAVDELDEEK